MHYPSPSTEWTIRRIVILMVSVLAASVISGNAQEKPSSSNKLSPKAVRERFQNSPIPDQGHTSICAGVSAIFAVEQSLGVKFKSLEEVFDVSQMISSKYDRVGSTRINPNFIVNAYGVVRDKCYLSSDSFNQGIAKIEEAVTNGNIAIVFLMHESNNKHMISISDHRLSPKGFKEYKVHESAGGKVIWETEASIKQKCSAYSRGNIVASIIDCSQRVTGHLPVDLPEHISLTESIHDAEFCKLLDKSVVEFKSKAKNNNQLLPNGPTSFCDSLVVNLSEYWNGEVNQKSVPGISRILRSNLLAQRKVCATINYTDEQGKKALRFGTLIECDSKGFFFNVDDQTVHILEQDLPSALSEPVMGYLGSRKKPNTPQRNLLLVYPRDSEGKAIVGTRKAESIPIPPSTD